MNGVLMSAPSEEIAPEAPSAPAVEQRLPAGELDASCRQPVLLLFTSALVWFVVGMALLFAAAIKLHAPGFLAQIPWLTFGRIRPAAMNAVVYGFACQAALGVMLWMLCRLGGNRLLLPVAAFAGGMVWNLGVTIGVLAVLGGFSTGFEWLEMPASIAVLLLIGYALMGAAAGVTFHFRQQRELYVSQWYLLAALFWFPWIYSAANLLLLVWPTRGTVQAVVNAWFTHNLLGLWLTPIALASIFYFVPKLLRRPLHSWWLAVFGFWTLAFFVNWSGLTPLAGGPVPAWMVSTSIAANVLLVVPLLASAVNWALTAQGAYGKLWEDLTLRYITAGAAAYFAASLGELVLGIREVSAYINFSMAAIAPRYLALLGFVGLSLLGSMYYIVPRLVQQPWPLRGIRLHFWLTLAGIALVCGSFFAGGLLQSAKMDDATLPFINVVRATVPFIGMATLGWLLLLAGQIIFLLNLLSLVNQYSQAFRKSTRDFLAASAFGPEVRP